MPDEIPNLRESRRDPLRRVTLSILDSRQPAHTLRPEVVEMATILGEFATIRFSDEQDLASGESRTPQGLALSPKMAQMCADDFVRTIKFIRGTHDAITDVRKRFPDRPARVLYAGCGPFATLAIPLMTIFTAEEATFTLLDIHSQSVDSVKSIVESLGLVGSVTSLQALDAGLYRIDPDQTPDVILMEIMQACLEAEPQVAITRHLLSQTPDAILIPEEVEVSLKLVDMSREFILDGSGISEGQEDRDRVAVDSVFVLNRDAVNSWQNVDADRLPAATVRIPDSIEQRYQPMLFTSICVYQDHVLKDYDSGLTCPRVLSINRPIEAGDTIQFHYELGQHPGLKGI